MPVEPPSILAPGRFNPAYVTNDDLLDLSTFTGMTVDACLERLRSYSMAEHANAWAAANPTSPEEVLAFYRYTDLYLWELMQWHASADRQPYWEVLSHLSKHYLPERSWRRVYDFGCGVGTDALFLATRGYEVTLVDVDSPAFRFARHRFERRGLKAEFVESTSTVPSPRGEYDLVVCFDVFEHLPDPLFAAAQMIKALRKGGLLVQRGTFSDEGYHPCHLRDGIARYRGVRWHIHLAGLGMRNTGGMIYERCSGVYSIVQKIRYALWRVTGLWATKVGK